MSASKDLEVSVEADCGNAPKEAQVRDWLIALAEGDVESVCRGLDLDVRWDVAGENIFDGMDEVHRYVAELAEDHIERHISHARQGSVVARY